MVAITPFGIRDEHVRSGSEPNFDLF